MARVSLLTVTARTGWGMIAALSLSWQEVLPDEWIIVTEHEKSSLNIQAPKDVRVKIIQAPVATRVNNLNASNNEGIRNCTGDYIIFWQDFIEMPPDTIKKLIDLVDDNMFVTTLTDGKKDPRYVGVDGPRPCRPDEWEENVAIAPRKAFYELGGYDEEYDNGWAWNNVNVAERAEMLGYKFILDESNQPILHHHSRIEESHNLESNGERHAQTMRDIRDGIIPLRNSYLL